MSWPTCGEAIAPSFDEDDTLNLTLHCVLPKGHQYDGDPLHLDGDTGARWQWTITTTTGEVIVR